jgi:UDP-N-acetylglucosamine 4,6-dehydratase/UDP-glucose 4-epimerase
MIKMTKNNTQIMKKLRNKKILITGGTGSLGTALTKRLLKSDVNTIRIFSRDELKQTKMQDELNDDKLRFLIGDVRDEKRLSNAMEDIDIVFHTAALKHVPIAEYNAFEAIKTNVYGSQNVIETSYANDVKTVIGVGTDKAVSPTNAYGATKLLMEKIFTSANFQKSFNKTKYVCVRYGNVLGSRGSILPKLLELIGAGKAISITDPQMTRFNITMSEAVDLVLRALDNGKGGEIFVPKLKAYDVETMKNAIIELSDKKVTVKKIPIRIGEKKHEMLINEMELQSTLETKKDYIIANSGIKNIINPRHLNYKKTTLKKSYVSNSVELIKKNELKQLIIKHGLLT